MNTIEERLGYLVAKAEEQGADLKAMSGKLDDLEQRVNEKFASVEALIKVLKWLGALTGALITIQWSDIPRLWAKFFS